MAELTNARENPFAALGRQGIALVNELGAMAIFAVLAVANIFTAPLQFRKILNQLYFIGFRSLPVILLVSVFTGMVLGLQGYYTLAKFGSTSLLGPAVALSLIRELGPVLTAIMVIARAGSSMAAEIGIMRISEQIDALDTMNINPIKFLVSPRIVASLISFPLLTAVFNVMGIIGGYLTGVLLLHLSAGTYFTQIQASVVMHDITGGFLKAVVFGFLVTVICCFQGFFTHMRPNGFGAKGVSMSTTSAVVLSCVAVLVVDYILTSFLL
ncbi:MlaE family ABC transporter permease [Desulfonatronum parangueonense]